MERDRTIRVALAVALVAGTLGAGAGAATALAEVPAGVPATVRRLAPHVLLHPLERAFPASAQDFLAASKLRWRTCGFRPGAVIAAAPGPAGAAAFAAGLVQGAFTHPIELGADCATPGPPAGSAALTRPLQRGAARLAGLPLDQGIYLEAAASALAGRRPLAGRVRAPMYFEYQPRAFVTYWFFYGDSGVHAVRIAPLPAPYERLVRVLTGHTVRIHQGDWERVSVHLDSRDRPIAIAYHQHGRPLVLSWAALRRSRLLEGDTHPVVYSARASHASYPGTGTHPFRRVVLGRVVTGAADETLATGARWRGEADLRDARAQPWYGFGGAWGAPGRLTGGANPELRTFLDIGPLGPSPYTGLVPCGWHVVSSAGLPVACDRALRRGASATS